VWLPHTYSLHAVPPRDERAFYVNSIAHPPSPYTRQKRELQFTASGYVLYAPRTTMLYWCGDRYAPIACLAHLAASRSPHLPTSQPFHGHWANTSQYSGDGHKVISCWPGLLSLINLESAWLLTTVLPRLDQPNGQSQGTKFAFNISPIDHPCRGLNRK